MNTRIDTRPMGIVRDMPFEDYLAIDAFSNSDMKLLARSAWHWKNRLRVTQTRPMLRGSLVHCAQLEPHALHDRYVFVPADAPRRPTAAQWNAKKSSEDSAIAKEWWSRFNEDAGLREIVTADEFFVTQQQLAAIAAEAELSALFASGDSEVSIFWIDQATGVYCKARPDHLHYLSHKRVKAIDLKASADDSPEGFGRAIPRMGHHRQEAHYTQGLVACGLEVDEFIFAVVSSAPPVIATPMLVPEDFADQAREEVHELRAMFVHCQRTGVWRGYNGGGKQVAKVPAYAYRNHEVEIADATD